VHYADASVFDLDHNDQIDPARNGQGATSSSATLMPGTTA
jgi:hypothetical protein